MNSHPATDAAAILAGAEHRRLSGGPGADFMACLIDEVVTSCAAGYLHLWEVCPPAGPHMIWKRGSDEGVPKHVLLAANGVVKQVRGVSSESGAPSIRGFVTSCQVAEGIQLVLECGIPDHRIDPQQLVDLAEIFADLHRRKLVSTLYRSSLRDHDLNQIIEILHLDPDPVRVANCVASDPVELLGCSRISVARRRLGGAWNLVASTGVSQPDPRADATQVLCRLIDEACQKSGAAALPGPAHPGCSVRPLSVSGRWDTAEWAAVFEWPDDAARKNSPQFVSRICQHASLAFQNGTRQSGSGAGFIFRFLPEVIRGRRALVAATLLSGVAAALVFWKIELRIEVQGRLVPSKRALIFAPEDGVITDVPVEDGSVVHSGDLLCRLRNEDLEIQLVAVDGEAASAGARLAAIESMRGDRSPGQAGLLSAEQAELKERLISFEAQSEILNKRIGRLDLTAAMNGRIYGDRIQELLRGRPVQRGQYLFELADPDSGWQLDFRIAESDARHVIEARNVSKEPIAVSYALETEPERLKQTSLSRISPATEIDEFGRLSTLATAVPESITVHNPRPGAGVVGQIHCGKHSAGYVLFRRLIEALQRRWWI